LNKINYKAKLTHINQCIFIILTVIFNSLCQKTPSDANDRNQLHYTMNTPAHTRWGYHSNKRNAAITMSAKRIGRPYEPLSSSQGYLIVTVQLELKTGVQRDADEVPEVCAKRSSANFFVLPFSSHMTTICQKPIWLPGLTVNSSSVSISLEIVSVTA